MKRSIQIIIIVFILILGGGGLLFSFGYLGGENTPEAIQNLFPEGENTNQENTGNNNVNSNGEQFPSGNNGNNGSGETIDTSRFSQIFLGGVSGYTVLEQNGNTLIRFMEKETGHIYDYNESNGSVVKQSNQTMPGVEEVVWSKDGNAFVARYFDQDQRRVKTTLLSFDKEATESNLYTFTRTRLQGDRGEDILFLQRTLNQNPETQIAQSGAGSPGNETEFFGGKTTSALKALQAQEGIEQTGNLDAETLVVINDINQALFGTQNEDITETSLSVRDLGDISMITSNGDSVFYTKEEGSGIVGYVDNFFFSSPLRIFESPLREWSISWPEKNTILLQTKASSEAEGTLYALNPSTGSLVRILSKLDGLVAQGTPNKNTLVYSQTQSDSVVTSVLSDGNINNLQIRTLAEKCIGGNNNENLIFCAVPESLGTEALPDAWYKGLVSFSDQLWMINSDQNTDTLLFDSDRRSLSIQFDAIAPQTNKADSSLYFINKKDGSLWGVRLSQ